MATVTIPTRTDGIQRYSLRCQLGTRYFTLEFRWNARDQSWGFVISDAAGNVLAARKVLVSMPLSIHQVDDRMPDGEFIAVDTTGKDQDPGLTELGGRVLLTFTDAADFV
jgi:hypothetical protein